MPVMRSGRKRTDAPAATQQGQTRRYAAGGSSKPNTKVQRTHIYRFFSLKIPDGMRIALRREVIKTMPGAQVDTVPKSVYAREDLRPDAIMVSGRTRRIAGTRWNLALAERFTFNWKHNPIQLTILAHYYHLDNF